MLDAWLLALGTFLTGIGLKPLPVAAGFFGGAIAGGLLPGPLAALASVLARLALGALCGGIIAGYGAQPLAAWLGHADAVGFVALGLGVGGLSFCFKVLDTWNRLELVDYIKKYFPGRSA